MELLNIEIKAKCSDHTIARQYLLDNGAISKGVDHQIDTYFSVHDGRMKMREGSMSSYLVYYKRSDQIGPKQSDIIKYDSVSGNTLKKLLTASLGIMIVVEKKRDIYVLDNVVFHIDTVDNLGTFVEIEVVDKDGTIGREKLLEQCNYYLKELDIQELDLLEDSYSDMLLRV